MPFQRCSRDRRTSSPSRAITVTSFYVNLCFFQRERFRTMHNCTTIVLSSMVDFPFKQIKNQMPFQRYNRDRCTTSASSVTTVTVMIPTPTATNHTATTCTTTTRTRDRPTSARPSFSPLREPPNSTVSFDTIETTLRFPNEF